MAQRTSKRIKAQPEARRPKKLIDGQRTYKAHGKVVLTHSVAVHGREGARAMTSVQSGLLAC